MTVGLVVVVLLAVQPTTVVAGRAMETTQRMIREEFPEVAQISTAELSDRLTSQGSEAPILLDVREAEEYAVSHLANAHRTSDLQSALAVLGDSAKNRPIVVYCSVGYRSAKLAQVLTDEGYGNVHNLEGSIFQWANEGRPVHRDGQQVREVHPYNWLWGRLLAPDLRSR